MRFLSLILLLLNYYQIITNNLSILPWYPPNDCQGYSSTLLVLHNAHFWIIFSGCPVIIKNEQQQQNPSETALKHVKNAELHLWSIQMELEYLEEL